MRKLPLKNDSARLRDCEFLSEKLYVGREVSITRKRCFRQDWSRSDEEQQKRHVLVFPISGVNVLHIGDCSFVVDPSQVTLFNAGDVYRVSHPKGSGEVTIHVAIEEKTLANVLESRVPCLAASEIRPFRRSQVKRSPQLHLELLQLMTAVHNPFVGALEVEESALGLVDAVAADLAAFERMPRPSLSRSDRELANAAATVLAARYAEPLSLGEISEGLGVSKFRLCRVFKRVSGETLWQRIQQLRARHAAVELATGVDDLADLALALGFSSHSHFAASFRRVFGTTPSAVRHKAEQIVGKLREEEVASSQQESVPAI